MSKQSPELASLKLACSICSPMELRGYYKVAHKKKDKDRLEVIQSVAKLRNIKLEEKQHD